MLNIFNNLLMFTSGKPLESGLESRASLILLGSNYTTAGTWTDETTGKVFSSPSAYQPPVGAAGPNYRGTNDYLLANTDFLDLPKNQAFTIGCNINDSDSSEGIRHYYISKGGNGAAGWRLAKGDSGGDRFRMQFIWSDGSNTFTLQATSYTATNNPMIFSHDGAGNFYFEKNGISDPLIIKSGTYASLGDTTAANNLCIGNDNGPNGYAPTGETEKIYIFEEQLTGADLVDLRALLA